MDSVALENKFNYTKKEDIKRLLKNYEVLQESDDETAIAITVDLNNAIRQLNKRQKECVVFFINGLDLETIALILNIRFQTVHEHITKAIRNIQIYLIGKELLNVVEDYDKTLKKFIGDF